MKLEKGKCPMCQKHIKYKTWITRKGLLKGQTIVDIWVHKDCKKLFELVIALNEIEEMKEELEKKIGIK